jgi:N-acetyl-gamma-glutamyl-phosphate reductase
MIYRVGILGARGYVGKEFIEGVLTHPNLQLAWVSSRQLAGQPITKLVPGATQLDLTIEELSPDTLADRPVDILVLALPNSFAAPYVAAVSETPLIIDLSADYRFDDEWVYSVPEIHGDSLHRHPIRISNPGCYATAMQLAIAPVIERLAGDVHCVGISGYSGAGTKPGPNNNPDRLKDNILPYALIEHIHEREVSRHMGCQIHFSPHVASFFRGINMTVQWRAKEPQDAVELVQLFYDFYQSKKYVQVQKEIPNIQQVVHTPNCIVGGFSVSQDGLRISQVSVIDNLAKGAASQAMQNINLNLGLDEHLGIDALYQVIPGDIS